MFFTGFPAFGEAKDARHRYLGIPDAPAGRSCGITRKKISGLDGSAFEPDGEVVAAGQGRTR
ncbi:hypothetical protein HNR02_005666 [Amycolatopsis endophytica]|uniref:Uncharacterized protein n=1 Tax=Amycolatopsis endophytica TaxID=860233 RepID=A0A853BC96_9PSEU|nr:hypothetical protein [Amycolatopsis endophytica]